MNSTHRTEYFEVLGEKFSKIHYPELYDMYKISPKNLEVQLSSLAEKWHNGSINSASRCLESDLEHMTGRNTKLVWIPDELEHLFGQNVYTCNLQNKTSFCVRSEKLYKRAYRQISTALKEQGTLVKGKTFFFKALHTKTAIDPEGILEVPDRYKDMFLYDKAPSFEITNQESFVIHFNHEN